MTISARGLTLDTQTMRSGQNALELNISATKDLEKTAGGVGLKTALTQAYTFNTVLPTSTLTPSADGQLATKKYVDDTVNALRWKYPARVISTTNITLSGTQTIDGVALIAGDRVLVAGQTIASGNGLYVVAAGAWTRTADLATGSSANGIAVIVEQGTVNQNSLWQQTIDNAVTNTTGLSFSQIGGTGAPTAGTGISVSGTTVSLNIPGLTDFASTVAMSDTIALVDVSAGNTQLETTMTQVFNGVYTQATSLAAPTITDTLLVYDASATSITRATLDAIFQGEMADATSLGAAPAALDTFLISDVSNSNAVRKVTVTNMKTAVAGSIEQVTLIAGQVTARSVTLTDAVTDVTKCWATAFGGAQFYHGNGITFTAGAAGAATATWAAGTAGDGSLGGNLITGDIVAFHYV